MAYTFNTPFFAPKIAVVDSDGFAPPNSGGTEAVKYATVLFSDTSAKALFTLIPGSYITGWLVNVTQAFNGQSANVLNIGDVTVAARFGANISVSSTGQTNTGFVATEFHTAIKANLTVYGTFSNSGTAATTGSATVQVRYVLGTY